MDLSEQPLTPTFLRHPWELAKGRFLINLAQAFCLDSRPVRVLDAGAGDGWIGVELLHALPDGSSLISWDVNYRARPAPAEGQRFTATLDGDDRCEVLLALDVLEHLEDPRAWLGGLVSGHLVRHGHAIVSVPAWPCLYGNHDRRLQHYCRFHPATARRLVESAGLRVLCQGSLFLSLLPVRLLGRLAERARPRKGGSVSASRLEWRWGRGPQRLAAGVLNADCRLALAMARRRVAVPGLSWWALCQKISS